MISREIFNMIRKVGLGRANLLEAARRAALRVALAVLSLTAGVQAQAFSNTPPALPENFEFSHPMTVINQTELAVVKQRIADKIEPQASAFAQLIRDADAARSFVPDPPETMDIMGGYEPNNNQETVVRPWLWRNGHAAYCSALAFAYTGKTNYADKAVEILNAWAAKKTVFTGRDRGLQLGSWFSPMLYAADLLHNCAGWKSADRDQFNSWWRTNCLVHIRPIARERRNNWKDAGLLGVMSAGVVLEDKALLNEALKELDNYFGAHTDKRGQMTNEWKIKKDEHGVYLVAEVGRNNGRSGITYTAYSLTTMVQALEIARYAGQDFWHRRTVQRATLQDVIEQYFRWDILKQPFPWNANPDRLPTRKNPYEIANNHFNLDPQTIDWLKTNRPVNGAQGDEYVTLNKGDLPAPDKK
jgi:hypothetical protein